MEYPLTFEQFQEGLSQRKLRGLHCLSCGYYTVPPQGVCRNCGGKTLEPTEMSGEGLIRTFTVIRVAPEGQIPPYVLILVELNQGPWVLGRLSEVDPDKTDMNLIGKKVCLETNPEPGGRDKVGMEVLRFRPAA